MTEIKLKKSKSHAGILCLYILIRSDLTSLNPGKLGAQTSHAASTFAHFYGKTKAYKEWASQTDQGFGVVVTKAAKIRELTSTVSLAKAAGYFASIILDPSYPISDGEVTHSIPLDTCGFIFGRTDDLMLRSMVDKFEWYP